MPNVLKEKKIDFVIVYRLVLGPFLLCGKNAFMWTFKISPWCINCKPLLIAVKKLVINTFFPQRVFPKLKLKSISKTKFDMDPQFVAIVMFFFLNRKCVPFRSNLSRIFLHKWASIWNPLCILCMYYSLGQFFQDRSNSFFLNLYCLLYVRL